MSDEALDRRVAARKESVRRYREWLANEQQAHPEKFAWMTPAQELSRLLVGATITHVEIVHEDLEVDGFERDLDVDLTLADGRTATLWVRPGHSPQMDREDFLNGLWESGGGLQIELHDENLEHLVPEVNQPAYDGYVEDDKEEQERVGVHACPTIPAPKPPLVKFVDGPYAGREVEVVTTHRVEVTRTDDPSGLRRDVYEDSGQREQATGSRLFTYRGIQQATVL